MESKSLKNRYSIIGWVFFFLFFFIWIRLMFLQVIRGPKYREVAQNVTTRFIPLQAPRGNIYDRYGRLVAGNKASFDIAIIPNEIKKNQLNDVILKLLKKIKGTGSQISVSFPLLVDKNNRVYFEWETNDDQIVNARKNEFLSSYKLPRDSRPLDALLRIARQFSIQENLEIGLLRDAVALRHQINMQGYRPYEPITIVKNADNITIAVIEEISMDLPGIVILNSYNRVYPNGMAAAHIIGYMGKIPVELWMKNKGVLLNKGYRPSVDLIGRSEIESVMEDELRGINGRQRIEVNVKGRSVRVVDTVLPTPGNDVFLTIDLELQKTVEASLEKTMNDIRNGAFGESFPNAYTGCAVAIDIHSGEVLALANRPAFDPNLFSDGSIPVSEWKKLNPIYINPQNPQQENRDPILPRPMMNNAVRGAFPPGSTFKMVVALAGLQEKVVYPQSIIVDQGRYTKISPINAPACWIWNEQRKTHGPEDVAAALRDSCNYYFYEVGNRLGIDKIERYAHLLGLGEKTGIELSGETSGIVAGIAHTNGIIQSILVNRMKQNGVIKSDLTENAKEMIRDSSYNNIKKILISLQANNPDRLANEFSQYINAVKWTPGKTLSAAIGQGENTYSPLQMAAYIATLINGGKKYPTHLIKKITTPNGNIKEKNEPKAIRKINISPDNYRAILEGMHGVTSSDYQSIPGTAAKYFYNFPIPIVGKTGTAQFSGHDNYAWFVGAAPYDHPQIAVAVMIAQGGHGGYAAPVAKDTFMKYFGLNQHKIPMEEPNSLKR